jgi:hypothetical protein
MNDAYTRVDQRLLAAGHILKHNNTNTFTLVSTHDYGDSELFITIEIRERDITVKLNRNGNNIQRTFVVPYNQLDYNYEEIVETYTEFHKVLITYGVHEKRAKWLKKRLILEKLPFNSEEEFGEEIFVPVAYRFVVDMIGKNKSELLQIVGQKSFEYFQQSLSKQDLNLIFAVANKLGVSGKEIKPIYNKIAKNVKIAKNISR